MDQIPDFNVKFIFEPHTTALVKGLKISVEDAGRIVLAMYHAGQMLDFDRALQFYQGKKTAGIDYAGAIRRTMIALGPYVIAAQMQQKKAALAAAATA